MTKPRVDYEFESTPDAGDTQEIADGVHWLRMPLPFALNHINLWLFQDGDGWAIVDSGVGTDASKQVWQRTFSGLMKGAAATRIIVTHLHPDHVGCAGWLAERFDVDLWMTREEYLLCRILVADTGREVPDEGVQFYSAAGFPDDALGRYRKLFGMFGKYVTPLPESYKRLYDGLRGPIGEHRWEVVVGRGHSPEHACFYCDELNLMVSGDQILPTISSNVSVYPTEPLANPLKDWIDTLTAMKSRVPADVLVLPAHGRPFRGAHSRIDRLVSEHLSKLDALLDYCNEPRRAVDVFPALYRTKINSDNLLFATGEAIAHLNYLLDANELLAEPDADNVVWYRRI
jgi:glyoxylase-like metal-dependent hydrolase (beta-lactamase superfamily II)